MAITFHKYRKGVPKYEATTWDQPKEKEAGEGEVCHSPYTALKRVAPSGGVNPPVPANHKEVPK